MPGPVCRVGDANEAGGIIVSGNPTILVNGRPIATLGDQVTPHPCCGAVGCPPIHCAATTLSTGYTILAGGKPVVVLGDTDTCGHKRSIGSFDVIAG
jgi:uncharacterized Zn-binding protein involved in type VI secretion